MLKCVCVNCETAIEVGEDSAGSAVICKKCGCIIQIPELPQTQPTRKPNVPVKKRAEANPKSKRGQVILGGLYGSYLILLPISLWRAQDGTPLCLTLFALNLILGVCGGFFFFAGIHTPDYLVNWLNLPFNRLRVVLLLMPLMILGFLTAYYIYAP